MEKKEQVAFLKKTINEFVKSFNEKLEENELSDLKITDLTLGKDSLNIICPLGTHPKYILDENGEIVDIICEPDKFDRRI